MRDDVRRIAPECRDAEGRIVVPLNSGGCVALPEDCVIELSASGPVDAAAAYWASSDQVDWGEVSADDIRAELEEAGAWDDDDLADDHANRERLLWILSGNVAEDSEMYRREGGAE